MFNAIRSLEFSPMRRHFAVLCKQSNIYTGRVNNVGVITMKNSEENMTDFGQIFGTINGALDSWRKESELQLLLLNFAPDKGVGPGNGIKGLFDIVNDETLAPEYFSNCYNYTHHWTRSTVPSVAILNGRVTGSFATLAANCTLRVATENAELCHPEVQYGFYPDNAAILYLWKAPGTFGQYLALTGQNVCGRDLVKCRIATHFVTSKGLPNLIQGILGLKSLDANTLNSLLHKHHEQWKKDFGTDFSFKDVKGRMNNIFREESIESIVLSLEEDKSAFANKALEQIHKASPTSLKVTVEMFQRCKNLSVRDCLIQEYNVSMNIIRTQDFRKGVLAASNRLSEKLEWNPSSIKDVTRNYVASFFAEQPAPLKLKANNGPPFPL